MSTATECPEGHSLRNGERILSACWICADAELKAAGATHFSDLGYEPTPHFLPEAERLRRFARDT